MKIGNSICRSGQQAMKKVRKTMRCSKLLLTLVFAGAACLSSTASQASAAGQIYECDADFTGASGYKTRGIKPSSLFFQIIEGASKVPALDPLTFRQDKMASAKQKVGSDGVISLSWSFQIPTTAGYSMGGSFRIKFDPKSMTGTVRSTSPPRLVNGGSLDGLLSCKPVTSFPKKA